MIISRLALKNWRNFRSVDVTLEDRVFVIGPNASGKSNLLDALRFLRDIAKPGGGLQQAIRERGGLSKVRCLAARKDPDVEITVTLSENDSPPEFEYAIGITQQVRGYRQPILRYERVLKNGLSLLDRPDKQDEADELRLTQTHLEQISANAPFRPMSRFFESIRYLHVIPQLLRHPESFQGPTAEDPFGRNFLEIVAKTPERTRRSRLRRIEAALRQAVPQLTNLTDTKDDAGIPHLEVVYEHWRPNAGRQREDQFSDGTIRLIGLFWSLLEGDAPLLLEEPELSLHAEIVRKLPALFSRLQRKRRRQLFISTHSWDLLADKGIGGEEILMLTPSKDGTEVVLGSSNTQVRSLLDAGLSVADAALPLTAPPQLHQLDLFE
jgi:predicted ATPase